MVKTSTDAGFYVRRSAQKTKNIGFSSSPETAPGKGKNPRPRPRSPKKLLGIIYYLLDRVTG